jgi:hypothetical protein
MTTLVDDNVGRSPCWQGVIIMGARYQATARYSGTRADIVRAAQEVAAQSGLKVREANPEEGLIKARAGFSFRSWGENISVHVDDAGTVQVTSECLMPTQLVDYGKNKSNVKRFLAGLSARLGDSPVPS